VTPAAPSLSVVLACTDRFPTIATTVGHLAAQSIRDRIEVVLVARSREDLDLPEGALACFWGHRVVEISCS
jgi:hypothetical protein